MPTPTTNVIQAEQPSTTNATPAASRIEALDVFRGLAISAMIVVNNPGSPTAVFSWLSHSPWHGYTLADLVFPFFLFSVGASVLISLQQRRERGDGLRQWILHAIVRAALLILLGLILNGWLYLPWGQVRWSGVLQRIGVVYLVTALITWRATLRSRAAAAAALLVGYWLLLALSPPPGSLSADFSPQSNLASYLDRRILAGHLWQPDYDPEGLLSTLPAVATCLLGTIAGQWLTIRRKNKANLGDSDAKPADRWLRRRLNLAGLGMVASGLIWGLVFPINKTLWSSSFALLTAGLASLVLAACCWAGETRTGRRLGRPFQWQGRNALLLYFGSEVLAMALLADASEWVSQTLLASWLTPAGGSLLWALAYAAFWTMISGILYSRRIFVKL